MCRLGAGPSPPDSATFSAPTPSPIIWRTRRTPQAAPTSRADFVSPISAECPQHVEAVRQGPKTSSLTAPPHEFGSTVSHFPRPSSHTLCCGVSHHKLSRPTNRLNGFQAKALPVPKDLLCRTILVPGSPSSQSTSGTSWSKTSQVWQTTAWIFLSLYRYGPVQRICMGIASCMMSLSLWSAGYYAAAFMQSVRVYFGVYHGIRILIDVWGLLAVHMIGRLGLLRPSKWLMRFVFGGPEGRQKISIHRRLGSAQTYEEWKQISLALDQITGVDAWCNSWSEEGDSNICDFPGLESHIQALRIARHSQNWIEIAFLLRVCCNRNFCHLRNPTLYAHSFVQTKKIVEDFYNEVCLCLDEMATSTLDNELFSRDNSDYQSESLQRHPLSVRELFSLISALRLSMGRTALCLSGGGGLAISHLGVIRALHAHDMMPRVVSGSSGGALIAGMLAVTADEHLERDLFQSDFLEKQGVYLCPPLWQQAKSFFKTGYLLDQTAFIRLTRTLIGELTFADAFAKTGRFVSITTTPAGTRGGPAEPLVCNCINTPDVLIWYAPPNSSSHKQTLRSATVASCSLPLVLPPSVLYTKPRLRGQQNASACSPDQGFGMHFVSEGCTHTLIEATSPSSYTPSSDLNHHRMMSGLAHEMAPVQDEDLERYAPESMRFVDGSILQDIPHTELQTLFNVKSFVVSQVNPHFTPFISGPGSYRQPTRTLSILLDALWNYLAVDLRNRYARLLVLAFVPSIRGQDVSPFLMQSAEGHVTIVPTNPQEFWRLTANPNTADVARGLRVGERKTWPYITRLKHVVKVETSLRELWLDLSNRIGSARPLSGGRSNTSPKAEGTTTSQWSDVSGAQTGTPCNAEPSLRNRCVKSSLQV